MNEPLNKRLNKAVSDNDLDEVKNTLSDGAEVDFDLNKALVLAAITGRVKIVDLLIEAGADIHTENDGPIRYAAEGCHSDVISRLIYAGVSAQKALPTAIMMNDHNIIKLLVDQGAAVDNDQGGNVLLNAINYNHIDFAKSLLNKGALPYLDLNKAYKTLTSLHDNKMLALLMEYGINPYLKDRTGRTHILNGIQLRPGNQIVDLLLSSPLTNYADLEELRKTFDIKNILKLKKTLLDSGRVDSDNPISTDNLPV